MSDPIITRGPKGQIYIWPTYRFGPDGERKLFDKPEDVPANFTRSPGNKPDAAALPSLDGMTKAELEAQAEAEGVDLDAIEGSGKGGNVLVDDIRNAIEENRK